MAKASCGLQLELCQSDTMRSVGDLGEAGLSFRKIMGCKNAFFRGFHKEKAVSMESEGNYDWIKYKAGWRGARGMHESGKR